MTSAISVRRIRLRSRAQVVASGPEAGQVGAERLELGAWRQWRDGGLGLRERLLGLGERGEPCFPALLEAARDEPVLGLAGVKGALGAVGLVAGALDRELGGAGRARAALLDLVGGGQRQRDLLGRERLKQPPGDGLVERVRAHRATARRLDVVGARLRALVVAAARLVASRHLASAAAADQDPLQQRLALARWALAGVGAVALQARLVAQETSPSRCSPGGGRGS